MITEPLKQEAEMLLYKFSHNLGSLLLPMILFFAPIKGILITVGAFIVLDTFSGIWKSRVTGVPISSRALSGVISKMLLYQACILSTYLLDYFVLGDILKSIFSIEGLLIKAAAMLLVFIEAQSINENYKIAKGIDLWNEFKKMLRRAKEVTTEVTGITKDMEKVKEIPEGEEKKNPPQDLGDIFED